MRFLDRGLDEARWESDVEFDEVDLGACLSLHHVADFVLGCNPGRGTVNGLLCSDEGSRHQKPGPEHRAAGDEFAKLNARVGASAYRRARVRRLCPECGTWRPSSQDGLSGC